MEQRLLKLCFVTVFFQFINGQITQNQPDIIDLYHGLTSKLSQIENVGDLTKNSVNPERAVLDKFIEIDELIEEMEDNQNNVDDKRIGEGLVPNRYSFNSVSVKTPQSSETDSSVLLPYHVRTKLKNSSQHTINSSDSESELPQRPSRKPPVQNYGYGSIEAGLAPPSMYFDDDDRGKQRNMVYDHSISAYDPSFHSRPTYDPFNESCAKYNEHHTSVSGSRQTQSGNGMVYISMLIGLILFVVVVNALFYIMKTMH